MASWVSPSVAADMWKMPVSEILARADRGELMTNEEGGFTFVNVDSMPVNSAGKSRLTPPTFSMVTKLEELALLESIDIATARRIVAQTRRRPMAA